MASSPFKTIFKLFRDNIQFRFTSIKRENEPIRYMFDANDSGTGDHVMFYLKLEHLQEFHTKLGEILETAKSADDQKGMQECL